MKRELVTEFGSQALDQVQETLDSFQAQCKKPLFPWVEAAICWGFLAMNSDAMQWRLVRGHLEFRVTDDWVSPDPDAPTILRPFPDGEGMGVSVRLF